MFDVDDDSVDEVESPSAEYVTVYSRQFPPRIAFAPDVMLINGGLVTDIVNSHITELYNRERS